MVETFVDTHVQQDNIFIGMEVARSHAQHPTLPEPQMVIFIVIIYAPQVRHSIGIHHVALIAVTPLLQPLLTKESQYASSHASLPQISFIGIPPVQQHVPHTTFLIPTKARTSVHTPVLELISWLGTAHA